MNPKPKRLSTWLTPRLRSVLAWVIVCTQILALTGTGALTALQPTPQMAQAVAQQAGLGDWFVQRAADLTAWVQPLFGAPKTAAAASDLAIGKSGPTIATQNIPFTYILSVTNTGTTATGTGGGSGNAIISAGAYNTCAITSNGGLKCWGHGGLGRNGNGRNDSYLTAPGDVTGLTSGVASVDTGFDHSCAVTSSGGVKCWGYNGTGQLGDGTNTDRYTPVDVVGLTSGVSTVAAGEDHTCPLTTSGGVKCWGYNAQAQLGIGTQDTGSYTPVDVSGLTSGVSAIVAGQYHNCALTTSGGVKCWGYNAYGSIGDGTFSNYRLTPVDVSGLTSGVTAIEASDVAHTCAITSGGGLKCWGFNAYGQLGDGTTTFRPAPVDVSGLTSGVSTVRSGDNHTCALTTSGGMKCWGLNSNGELGDGSTTQRLTPVDVVGLTSGVTSIAAGVSHSCAILSTGMMDCWGNAQLGQLGNSIFVVQIFLPERVATLISGDGVSASSVITVTDVLPAGLTFVPAGSGGGTGAWACSASGQTVTCTSSASIAASGSSSFPIVVNPTTAGVKTNTADVVGGGDSTLATSNSVNTTVNAASAPDLTTTIGQPLPSLMAGVQSSLPVTVTNLGTAPASSPIMTAVTLPAGVSAPASFSVNGWSCTTSGQTVTCSNAGPINNGSSSSFSVPVTAAAAGAAVTFSASTSPVSGESNTSNNAATPLTTSAPIAAFADGCFDATLTVNGAQETPPNSSTATGSATVQVNTSANTLVYSLSFSGLSPNMIHIHGPGAPGVSAAILHTLPGLSSPQTSQWSFAEGDQATILNGLTYFNLHTAAFGGGEIRGQIGALTPATCAAVSLPVKVLLQGAYDPVSGLMREQLRSLSSFPLTSPYGDGAVIAASSVLTANNIVDWVLVELCGTGALSTTVVASQGALLQRDGDVVGTDGVTPLSFTGLSGSRYPVVVKHRNHLGVMTANPVALSASTPVVDFSNPATAVFVRTRTVAQKSQSGKLLLWGGDANGDGDVKGVGPGTDPGAVRLAVLSHPGNTSFVANYVATGYAKADVTMNGQTIGAGPGNEVSNLILPNVLTRQPDGAEQLHHLNRTSRA